MARVSRKLRFATVDIDMSRVIRKPSSAMSLRVFVRRILGPSMDIMRRIQRQYDERAAWQRYTRTSAYMRAYARHWELEGPHA